MRFLRQILSARPPWWARADLALGLALLGLCICSGANRPRQSHGSGYVLGLSQSSDGSWSKEIEPPPAPSIAATAVYDEEEGCGWTRIRVRFSATVPRTSAGTPILSNAQVLDLWASLPSTVDPEPTPERRATLAEVLDILREGRTQRIYGLPTYILMNVIAYACIPLLAYAFIAGLARTLRRRSLRRRLEDLDAGRCPRCGYDRSVQPDESAPCPECGAAARQFRLAALFELDWAIPPSLKADAPSGSRT